MRIKYHWLDSTGQQIRNKNNIIDIGGVLEYNCNLGLWAEKEEFILEYIHLGKEYSCYGCPNTFVMGCCKFPEPDICRFSVELKDWHKFHFSPKWR